MACVSAVRVPRLRSCTAVSIWSFRVPGSWVGFTLNPKPCRVCELVFGQGYCRVPGCSESVAFLGRPSTQMGLGVFRGLFPVGPGFSVQVFVAGLFPVSLGVQRAVPGFRCGGGGLCLDREEGGPREDEPALQAARRRF